jgi:hypothetical protein
MTKYRYTAPLTTLNELVEHLVSGGRVGVIGPNALDPVLGTLWLEKGKLTFGTVTFALPYPDEISLSTYTYCKAEEVPWYESIPPQGVLCWVEDCLADLHTSRMVAIIAKYDGTKTVPFKGVSKVSWTYAQPVTQLELTKCLLENQAA